MNNERKESEQNDHGPIKDASLECIWSEQKNEINERSVSRPRCKAEKLTTWTECRLSDC
jgi:hypothetical protein